MTRVLVIGPGPTVIGEGGELDAAASDAVRALRGRGHEVILVTSNPATVASDPTLADRTYLEPLDLGTLRAVIAAEKPALVLPLFGGAKALELALALHDDGTLQRAEARLAGVVDVRGGRGRRRKRRVRPSLHDREPGPRERSPRRCRGRDPAHPRAGDARRRAP
jgi:hypothetical protein